MNIALIFAGGAGQRMNSKAKPKQFLEMHGKPILIYTLEYFEKHELIDNICIVCRRNWENELAIMLKRYDIKKVKWTVTGGETGHESIYNGLKILQEECDGKDIVLIHDGVRPLISEELLSRNFECVKKNGNAITVEAATETIIRVNNEQEVNEVPPRNQMKVAKAPQSFYLKDIWEVHEMARKDGFHAIDSAHLMNHYGRHMYTVESTPYNIKIATPSDYYVFRALHEARENSQIFGI